MTIEELLDKLEREPLAPAYTLYGPETFFMDQVLHSVLEKAFPAGAGRDMNYHILVGKEIKGDAVVREARTMPMFSPWRVLLLRQLQQANAAELEPLVPYLKSPSPSSCLLLFSTTKPDGRTTFGKALAKAGPVVECRHPYDNQIPAILRTMARKRQVRLTRDVEVYLAEVVGNDLLALDDALERLRLYAGAQGTIDLSTARTCVADTRVHEIWDLTTAIGERKLEKALKVLGKLRAEGLEAGRALPMLARTVRQLWTVRALPADKQKPDALAATLGLPLFVARNLAAQASRFSGEDLARAIQALHEADLTLKSSELPAAVREWVVLEELVWSLARG